MDIDQNALVGHRGVAVQHVAGDMRRLAHGARRLSNRSEGGLGIDPTFRVDRSLRSPDRYRVPRIRPCRIHARSSRLDTSKYGHLQMRNQPLSVRNHSARD